MDDFDVAIPSSIYGSLAKSAKGTKYGIQKSSEKEKNLQTYRNLYSASVIPKAPSLSSPLSTNAKDARQQPNQPFPGYGNRGAPSQPFASQGSSLSPANRNSAVRSQGFSPSISSAPVRPSPIAPAASPLTATATRSPNFSQNAHVSWQPTLTSNKLTPASPLSPAAANRGAMSIISNNQNISKPEASKLPLRGLDQGALPQVRSPPASSRQPAPLTQQKQQPAPPQPKFGNRYGGGAPAGSLSRRPF